MSAHDDVPPPPPPASEELQMDQDIDQRTTTPSDRPPFDPTAFVLGALFVVIAVIGLLDPAIVRRIDLGVLAPVTLVVLGGTLLAGSTFRGRGSRR